MTTRMINGTRVEMTPEEVAEFQASQTAGTEAALVLARESLSLTFAQMLIGLVAEEWITEAEGEAWLTGVLPGQVISLISSLPPAQRFVAKARASRPSIVMRMDPLVAALGASQGKTPDAIDQFFRTYAGS